VKVVQSKVIRRMNALRVAVSFGAALALVGSFASSARGDESFNLPSCAPTTDFFDLWATGHEHYDKREYAIAKLCLSRALPEIIDAIPRANVDSREAYQQMRTDDLIFTGLADWHMHRLREATLAWNRGSNYRQCYYQPCSRPMFGTKLWLRKRYVAAFRWFSTNLGLPVNDAVSSLTQDAYRSGSRSDLSSAYADFTKSERRDPTYKIGRLFLALYDIRAGNIRDAQCQLLAGLESRVSGPPPFLDRNEGVESYDSTWLLSETARHYGVLCDRAAK
jgi:hypothetical protein